MAWKNGGGRTRELWKVEDGGGMVWRASVATIHQSGEFSTFTGCDRIICLIAGASVTLHFSDGEVLRLELFEPQSFSCDRPVNCVVENESRDLNLIWRRDAIAVDYDVYRVSGTILTRSRNADWHLVVACGGATAVRERGFEEMLAPGEAVLFDRLAAPRQLVLELSSQNGFAIVFSISGRAHDRV